MNFSLFTYLFQVIWQTPHILLFPKENFSRTSQFEVNSLPDSPTLPPSWAGRLAVPSAGQGIWFNGGPGCSSLIGLMTGNGPISFDGNSTKLIRNPNSWTKLGHVLYIDQPVGTGFSTAGRFARTNDQVTTDFVRWLHTFYTYFPHLQAKKVHMMGESYAGIYVPYFANAIVNGTYALPLDLRSISIGDGSWAMRQQCPPSPWAPTCTRIPEDILSAFAAADQICGFDAVMEKAHVYPPEGKIHIPGNPQNINYHHRRDVADILNGSCDIYPSTPSAVLDSIRNSSCYGPCSTYSTAVDYMTAASTMGTGPPCFDVYDITHNCSSVIPLPLLEQYFSRSDVQAALHVKNSGSFTACSPDIMMSLLSGPEVVPPAYGLLGSLVTEHNLSLHIYNGELDMLINHLGTELSIQNMTWGGAQGFSKKPTQVFFTDDAAPMTGTKESKESGERVGTWGSERGLSYHLFEGAGIVCLRPSSGRCFLLCGML
ncbi:Peptidase S10 serine carboxypeptidase [Penicillium chermesinum]|uniref:Carboxypeptidase n=1 Tax=Penicillium chermesinum TaxID=63820 RepID=A0A9W9TPN2_9EURO|nr:Peptidase S10 serine carboxypeptidase [Penicillium chermesinum]KAJ5232449.1 Peptidase S10 serine carboxypeptidase [Penicillium chermesinum]